jgi:hypothetical protein
MLRRDTIRAGSSSRSAVPWAQSCHATVTCLPCLPAMNLLKIGFAEKHFEFPKGSLVVTDEPILKRGEKVYDPGKPGLNPLPMEYREPREFAAAVFPDKDLMAYRNGRRALTRLMRGADCLERMKYTAMTMTRKRKEWLRTFCSRPFCARRCENPSHDGFTQAVPSWRASIAKKSVTTMPRSSLSSRSSKARS